MRGGGGGGWSGGNGNGFGGYSLNTGTDQLNVAGFQTGHGLVEITPFNAVPEPGAAMLMASGFAALAAGAAWSRRRSGL